MAPSPNVRKAVTCRGPKITWTSRDASPTNHAHVRRITRTRREYARTTCRPVWNACPPTTPPPPTHPSPPYRDDGTRKPPPPDLTKYELPLPDEPGYGEQGLADSVEPLSD